MQANAVKNISNNLQLQARSQDFCWGGGGGGGGGACVRLRREMSSAAGASPKGVWGYSPPENFEKMGYLRPHFVRFEDSLLGNKPYKG